MFKQAICLLLALALLSGPAPAAWNGPVHQEVDYADMLPVTPFDETALLAALK